MSFEETKRLDAQLRGLAWRRLQESITVHCCLGDTWTKQLVTDVNDETREVRVVYDTVNHGVIRILDAAGYRVGSGLFQTPTPQSSAGNVNMEPCHPVASAAA